MFEPREIAFTNEAWAELRVKGVPVVEAGLRAFVGRCQTCGRAAELQHEGTVLVGLIEVSGTLYGDTHCVGCVNEIDVDEAAVVLPPLPRDAR